jgi:hypothetical protein
MASIKDLIGKTLTKVDLDKSRYCDTIIFHTDQGEVYQMYHSQDCCESVTVEDVVGDLEDLIGSPIIVAEERSSNVNPCGIEKEFQESFTWTFYELATIKGYVTIRWYGESNGYYSESVDFDRVENNEQN